MPYPFCFVDAKITFFRKFFELREKDFKAYEMEKRFLEEQRLRHMKTEKRIEELERRNMEKAAKEAVHIKQPLSENAAKEVWTEEEKLPENEFNPKTFFALNDLDGNGFLDLEEIRIILKMEYQNANKDNNNTEDLREQQEQIQRMEDFVIKEIDKNGDLMIDFEEYTKSLQNKQGKEEWTTEQTELDEEEFKEFEKQRIDEIRDNIADGKKPRGYNYKDVPLLDENFINETHIKYDGVLMKVEDSPKEIREKHFKDYAMEKRFETEEKIRHIDDPIARKKMEMENEFEKSKKIRVHQPMSPEQLKASWVEQDHKVYKSIFFVYEIYNNHLSI